MQVGGGIRDLRSLQRHLDAGATAVVIGTMLFSYVQAARAAVDLFGEGRIIAAVNVDGEEVKIRGWRHHSRSASRGRHASIEELGIRQVLMTDISHDGMAQGPNVALSTPIGSGACRR